MTKCNDKSSSDLFARFSADAVASTTHPGVELKLLSLLATFTEQGIWTLPAKSDKVEVLRLKNGRGQSQTQRAG
jgi:hypothetical protein